MKDQHFFSYSVPSFDGSIVVGDTTYATVLKLGEEASPNLNFTLDREKVVNYMKLVHEGAINEIRKEFFYVEAIRNLRKKIRFMNLNFEFQNDDITENEFENELKENESKYFVHVSLLKSEADFYILKDIVEKINDDLTTDDVADIFSIDVSTNQNLISTTV